MRRPIESAKPASAPDPRLAKALDTVISTLEQMDDDCGDTERMLLPENFQVVASELVPVREAFTCIQEEVNTNADRHGHLIGPGSYLMKMSSEACDLSKQLSVLFEKVLGASGNPNDRLEYYQATAGSQSLEDVMLKLIDGLLGIRGTPLVDEAHRSTLESARNNVNRLGASLDEEPKGTRFHNFGSGHQFNHNGKGHQNPNFGSGAQITGDATHATFSFDTLPMQERRDIKA